MTTLGKRSTAEQALRGKSLHAIVTGANSGLGTETARVLAVGGANVTLACRSIEAGQKVATQLRAGLPASASSRPTSRAAWALAARSSARSASCS